MNNIAIIPARGGSKRIPKKNIKNFLGKPIIAYSIEAALNSECFDEVMVSTDNQEIADVARSYGAKVPFMRSENTANDYATLADVVREVVEKYELKGMTFENACCLLATAPLVSSEDIKKGYSMLNKNKDITILYPVVQFSYPIQRCLQLSEDGEISMKWPEYRNSRSQDLEKLYHDTGTFYWYRVKPWMAGSIKRYAIVMEERYVQDIDTEEDWLLAELKYRFMHTK